MATLPEQSGSKPAATSPDNQEFKPAPPTRIPALRGSMDEVVAQATPADRLLLGVRSRRVIDQVTKARRDRTTTVERFFDEMGI